jgi:CIC family chloride channel protein
MSPAKTVDTQMTVRELVELLTITHSHGFAVLDNADHFWGVVTVTDVDRALARQISEDTIVMQIATPRDKVQLAYPDETIDAILTRMSVRGLGRLPVLSREDPEKLVGLVRRHDIIKAYNLALTRRAEVQHRAKQMELRNIDGIEFLTYTLEDNDLAVGSQVKDLAAILPDDCILVSIRRDGRVFVPHGKTRLQPGDQITAFVSDTHIENVKACLKHEKQKLEAAGAQESH